MSIKTLSFGCRLNALESEKIQNMLATVVDTAIVVNTCAVTGEAERQSGQFVRSTARENPNTPIFVTGCAATRNPALFCDIPNVIVIDNFQKRNINAYTDAMDPQIITVSSEKHLSKSATEYALNASPKLLEYRVSAVTI